jgi:tetratricopeptide (TPR) repeat protein
LKSDFAPALNHLGYMWADKGVRLDESRGMIEQAVKLDPKNAAYLDSLGWVLFKLGRPEEALGHLQHAAELLAKEPDATVLDHIGDALAALKRWPEAKEAWRKSLAIEPSDSVKQKLEAAPQ